MRARHSQQQLTAVKFKGAVTTALSVELPAPSSKQADVSFNFDLDKMKKAVEAKSHTMPDSITSFDDFSAWINQL